MDNYLNDLAVKYNTDKRRNKHGYVDTYIRHFEGLTIESLLEIGVYHGGSHKMWADYFPSAKIYGVDIELQSKRYESNRIQIDILDQGDKTALSEYAVKNGGWDIVIDDGSHMCSHQIDSFKSLWKHLKYGGYYVIEDTMTSFWPKSVHGYVDQEKTCVQYFHELVDRISALRAGGPGYCSVEKTDVEFIEYSTGLIIVKKQNRFDPKRMTKIL